MIRSKGYHSSSRDWLTVPRDQKGRINTYRILQTFKEGDKVMIYPEPRFQRNIPHTRFFGKVGVIVEKRGRAYTVKVRDGGKEKTIQLYPWHLLKIQD